LGLEAIVLWIDGPPAPVHRLVLGGRPDMFEEPVMAGAEGLEVALGLDQ
jgi:hypothetical protein